jgi:DNA-binding protein HU-beta
MRKIEIVAEISESAEITKVQAQIALETLLTRIQKNLKKEGRFSFYGLGVFEVVKRARRKARNPQTGEAVTVKAHKAVKFRAAKSLKDFVN